MGDGAYLSDILGELREIKEILLRLERSKNNL